MSDNTITVINTATYAVATIPPVAGPSPFGNPIGVAVTPDSKYVYVTNEVATSSNVSVIDTNPASPTYNTVVATVPVGNGPVGIAITPDGKYAYVANNGSSNVSVIATATNMVVATVALGAGNNPFWVAITPDSKYAYITTQSGPSNVWVIDTTTTPPSVVATVATGVGPNPSNPEGVAITPDGKHAYVANGNSGTVSIIDTATNTVESTMISVAFPSGVGIMPPPATPPTVPFLAFSAQLQLDVNTSPTKDAFALESSFTLSSTAPAINPVNQAVTFQAGPYSATIPAGSFRQIGPLFTYAGTISGVNVQALITPTGTMRYAFAAAAEHPNLTNTTNPVTVTLTIGNDSGTKSVNAIIFH